MVVHRHRVDIVSEICRVFPVLFLYMGIKREETLGEQRGAPCGGMLFEQHGFKAELGRARRR